MELTSERAKQMLGYLPSTIYSTSDVMKAVLQAQGEKLDEAAAAIESIVAQAYVRTADDWGLDLWEAEMGLNPNPSLTTSERQDRLVAHIRGYGTANIQLIKDVAESYVYGIVDVDDESTDPTLPDYTTRVTFIDEHGIPSNLTDVQSALRRVIPAHLDIDYEFNWTIWNDIDTIDAGGPHTWDEWDALALTWDQIEVFA